MTDAIWGDVPIYRSAADLPKPSRRTVLAGAGALFSATAFTVVTGVRARPAGAAAGTEYQHCAGYDGWKEYSSNTDPCVGGEYGSSWCGTDGWFKRSSGTCFNQWPYPICGSDNGYAGRNAWRWNHNGTPYRCADGVIQVCGSDPVLRICSWKNP